MFKNKKSEADSGLQDYAEKVMTEFQKNDFLGKAAEAGHKAKAEVKSKKYDEAWALYHEQKSLYMQHANQSGFTAKQALALDASVHEEMANILRLENKHKDALVDIVYWVMAGPERQTKRHQQKFQSYFNRCKFKNTTLSEAIKTIDAQTNLPEFTLAKSLVSEWVTRG